MKHLVAIAALLTAAPSIPQEATGQGTRWFGGNPPARYDGTGAAILILTNNIRAFCGDAPEGLHIVACVRRTEGGTPLLFMPSPREAALAGDPYAQILWHEAAHIAGWPGTHPAE